LQLAVSWLPPACFAVVAAVLLVWFMTSAQAGAPHLFDFHTFWVAGRDYAHGRDPYPAKIAGPISRADWFVYPAPVAALIAPLGLLPYSVAWVVFGVVLIAAVLGSLWLVGVRDWRCYALVFCALPVLKAANLGTMTPLLMLGAAAVWRLRDRTAAAALAAGATIVLKLFLWPLLPWLWFTGRRRTAVWAAAGAVGVSLLAWVPLGLHSLGRFPTLLHQLTITEAFAGYGVAGIAAALGASHATAGLLPTLVAPVVLVVTAVAAIRLPQRQSLALTIACAVAASPIVWEHYFALSYLCVGLLSQSFSLAWLLPLAYWALPNQQAWGSLWRCALALGLLFVCALSRRDAPSRGWAPELRLAHPVRRDEGDPLAP